MRSLCILLLIPNLLLAQNTCQLVYDADAHSVIISEKRPYFTNKDVFEQQLLMNARVKLSQEVLGVTVQQTIQVYQQGNKTVSTVMQVGTRNNVYAKFIKECYKLTYDGRVATLRLYALVNTTIETSTISLQPPPMNNVEPTPRSIWWKTVLPKYMVYVFIFYINSIA